MVSSQLKNISQIGSFPQDGILNTRFFQWPRYVSVTTQELKTRSSFGWFKIVTSGRSWEGKNESSFGIHFFGGGGTPPRTNMTQWKAQPCMKMCHLQKWWFSSSPCELCWMYLLFRWFSRGRFWVRVEIPLPNQEKWWKIDKWLNPLFFYAALGADYGSFPLATPPASSFA